MRSPPSPPAAPLALGAALLAAAAAGAASGGLPAHAEEVLAEQAPEARRELLEEGLVVLEDAGEDEGSSYVVALVLFERSPAAVRALMKQAERQTEYRPELDEVRTVATLPDGRVDEQSMKVLFTKLTYRLQYHVDPDNGRITWSLAEDFDNDLARMQGFWELYPFAGDPGRTLGRFGSDVSVGRAVPSFVQDRLSRKTVLRYVRNVRLWINSDGTWRH